MNEFTRNMKTALSADKKQRTGKNPRGKHFALLGALALLTIFSIFVLKIHFQSHIERMKRESVKLEEQINQIHIVLENRRNEKERLCDWSNIKRNIAYFKLPLVQRKPAQLTKLKRFSGAPDTGLFAAEQKNTPTRSYASNR